jgi:hypothetical protein
VIGDLPPEGIALRGKPRNSMAVSTILLLGVIVAVSDIAVAVQWLLRGREKSALFVFAGVVLVLCTVLVVGVVVLAMLGVRRQRYGMSEQGLRIPWRTRRLDLCLPWHEIEAIVRQYGREAGASIMGVAVVVSDAERVLPHRWRWPGSAARRAAERVREHGTPVYLDLTDVAGGTVFFFAAARCYATRAGRTDLTLR